MATMTAPPSPAGWRVAAIGLLGLAAAMGIGRFAFTPLLPLMQQQGLTLTEGGWLASANYLGYLVGALLSAAVTPAPHRAARWGLAGVAVLTVATGLTHSFTAWLMLRFGAGVASAFVLVGIAAWALAALGRLQRGALAGVVFAGVGVGIVLAGLVGLVAGVWQVAPERAWIALGAIAAIVCVISWPALQAADVSSAGAHALPAADRGAGLQWRLILCYGAFGFGYIVPATFLPAFARQLIDDAAVFGWVWPAFGAAAALSTWLSTRWAGQVAPHRLWAGSQLVMAVGVLAPALAPSLPSTLLSALCIGGTFMVATMAGLQHARASAGTAAPRLIAAMTAAFAIGQLIGPLTIRGSATGPAIVWPSMLAALVLLASSAALWHLPAPPSPATV